MKKIVLSILLTLVGIVPVFSQFDAQLSQYMFHNVSFNPAAVGEDNLIQITGQHRIQWVGMPNAPQTTVFSIHSPLKIGNSLNGIGIKFLNDKVGLFSNQSVYLQYAFKKKLGPGVISVGTDLGFISLGFRGDSVRQIQSDYHNISADPEIPSSSVVGMSFDMSLGAFYSTPKFYAGVSYSHVNGPKVTWGQKSVFRPTGSLYLTGGYNLVLSNEKYVFKPTTLIKTDMSSFQCDLTGRLEYDNKYYPDCE